MIQALNQALEICRSANQCVPGHVYLQSIKETHASTATAVYYRCLNYSGPKQAYFGIYMPTLVLLGRFRLPPWQVFYVN